MTITTWPQRPSDDIQCTLYPPYTIPLWYAIVTYLHQISNFEKSCSLHLNFDTQVNCHPCLLPKYTLVQNVSITRLYRSWVSELCSHQKPQYINDYSYNLGQCNSAWKCPFPVSQGKYKKHEKVTCSLLYFVVIRYIRFPTGLRFIFKSEFCM
jgi:hypothetical protein